MGTWNEDGEKLIDEIGKKLIHITGESRSKNYLIRRISIATQRGNAASILGTISNGTDKFDTVYYYIL